MYIVEVKASNAQSAPGLLSQALVTNGFIFTAGFIHLTPDGRLIDGSVEVRFRQVMNNIEEVLKAAGAKFDDVVKVAVCVKELPLGASIEISVVAIERK